MKEMSNSDYHRALRLLRFLASQKGSTLKEKEASLLVRKMQKLENDKP